MGVAPVLGLLVPRPIYGLWQWKQRPSLDKVRKANPPNLEPASNNQHVHSCSDKPTQAWGRRLRDKDSGWGVVCQTCPRFGSFDPFHAIQRGKTARTTGVWLQP